MLPQMTTDCIVWTFAGGACFMMGTLFLTYDRAAPFLHVLWHLAVLAGTDFTSQRFMCLWSKRRDRALLSRIKRRPESEPT